jgi:hypothetical protein
MDLPTLRERGPGRLEAIWRTPNDSGSALIRSHLDENAGSPETADAGSNKDTYLCAAPICPTSPFALVANTSRSAVVKSR